MFQFTRKPSSCSHNQNLATLISINLLLLLLIQRVIIFQTNNLLTYEDLGVF